MSNKTSKYINGLVKFINDTKPFHSKLTEIQEVYQFEEKMTVDIRESNRWGILFSSFWTQEYYSDGRAVNTFGLNRQQKINFLANPLFRGSGSRFTVGVDENKSLEFIDNAYDATSYALSDVVINRGDKHVFLHQGLDYHKSYGAKVFRVRQTRRVGYSEWVGKQTFTTHNTDGPFPIYVDVEITGADATKVRLGDGILIDTFKLKILSAGTIVVDGFVSESYYPLVSEKEDEGLLATATAATQLLAMDKHNPASAYNKIKSILTAIQGQLGATPSVDAQTELDALFASLETKIPNSFEALITYLVNDGIPVIPGYSAWRGTLTGSGPFIDTFVEDTLYSYTPNIVDNHFTDIGQWEYAGLQYTSAECESFKISNVIANFYVENFEEWTITAYDSNTLIVSGSFSGKIGTVEIGQRFTSTPISFSTHLKLSSLIVGQSVTIEPTNKLTVHPNAPLETWSIIKTDPFGYTRPSIVSTRYPFITDHSGAMGTITILDRTVKTGTILISLLPTGKLSVKHEEDSRIDGIANFGVEFNNGLVAFTVHQGSKFSLIQGEDFAIDIINLPPYTVGLDIFYPYDADGYDAESAVYNAVDDPEKLYAKTFAFGFDGKHSYETAVYDENALDPSDTDTKRYVEDYLKRLHFGYDSRFIGYDFVSFNFKFTSDEPEDNVEWRLRALPDYDKPLRISTTTPQNAFNLVGTDGGTVEVFDAPNSVLNGVLHTGNDPDTQIDILLYYASEFALEYFDVTTNQWVVVEEHAPIGSRYSYSGGFDFTIVQPDKNFIAAVVQYSRQLDSGEIFTEEFIGGDSICWTVRNPFPECAGVQLISDRAPRILMHSKNFSETQNFKWTANFKSPTEYSIIGDGFATNNGERTAAFSVDMATEDFSYWNKDFSFHYTIIPNVFGFDAGDFFWFKTFTSRPNYLVHGSVSGWQESAEYNKYYWNGKIGFKINPPAFSFYSNENLLIGDKKWVTDDGEICIDWVSHAVTDCIYKLEFITDTWVLLRNEMVVAHGQSVLDDGTVRIIVPSTKLSPNKYTIVVDSDDFDYSLGQNLVLMQATGFRHVRTDDVLFVEKSRIEDIHLHIQNSNTNNAPLRPGGMPISAYDLTTHQEPYYTIDKYSPETKLFSEWLPLSKQYYDVGDSTAVFRDTVKTVDVRSAASGQKIGTIKANDLSQPMEDVNFTFEQQFHTDYLPLNASLSVMTSHGGYNELVDVFINEKVRFFVSGSNGIDAMFQDLMTVQLSEPAHQVTINTSYQENVTSEIQDSRFSGFLPGYDNLPFDGEDVSASTPDNGYYDAGIVLVDVFDKVQSLLFKSTRTAAEDKTLTELLSLISPWASITDLAAFSVNEFINRIQTTPDTDEYLSNLVNWASTSNFGVPVEGLGIDVNQTESSNAATSLRELIQISTSQRDGAEVMSFEHSLYDSGSMNSTQIYVETLDAVPVSGINYNLFSDTELSCNGDVVISSSKPLSSCKVAVWISGAPNFKIVPHIQTSANSVIIHVPFALTFKMRIFG